MTTRSAYGSEVTRRARRVVGDIFAALGNRAENAVLTGGAVPGLIEDLSLRNAPGHAGTTDVDILLAPPVPGRSGFRIPIQAGLQARALSGAHVPAWFSVDLTIEQELVQGG